MWNRLVAALGRGIKSKGGQWVAAVLASLGLAFTTQAVITGPALDGLLSYMSGITGGSGKYMVAGVQMLAYINFDKAVTMVVSAYGIRAGLRAARAYLTKKA